MSSTDPQSPQSQPPAPTTVPEAPGAFTEADLQSIQGIGIAGFKKDHQELIFFVLPPPPAAKPLVAALVEEIATAQDVGEFNQQFSQYRHEHGKMDPDIQATWVALALSASGLEKLGADLTQLPAGDGRDAFVAGMAARATQIQDGGASAPANWNPAFRARGGVDGVLVVAADEPDDLESKVEALTDVITGAGAQVVFQERGETLLAPLTGHEHFGFKDGASQPAIVGYDSAPPPGEPAAVNAGEFVLGFPDQIGTGTTVPAAWVGGSFLVLRRLRQDVMAFRAFTRTPVAGADPAISSDLLAAKSVGRWPSGAPGEVPRRRPGSGS